MLSQIPYQTFTVSSGNIYVADQYGIIPNVVSKADQADLATAGCATLLANAPENLLGYKIAANFNITTDQIISNLNNALKFRVTRIVVTNASLSMTNADGGLYTGASKTGTAIVAAAQVYTALTGATVALDLTIATPNVTFAAGTPIYFSLTGIQGAAATADIYVYGDALPIS
jgi:hypothetical protein